MTSRRSADSEEKNIWFRTIQLGRKKAYPVVVSANEKLSLPRKQQGELCWPDSSGGTWRRKSEGRTDGEKPDIRASANRKPAGRKGAEGKTANDIWDAEYLATPDAICPEYLERIVRRHIGLPWIITETDRLLIREFTMEDIAGMPEEPDVWFTQEEREADQVFYDAEKIEGLYQRPVPLL